MQLLGDLSFAVQRQISAESLSHFAQEQKRLVTTCTFSNFRSTSSVFFYLCSQFFDGGLVPRVSWAWLHPQSRRRLSPLAGSITGEHAELTFQQSNCSSCCLLLFTPLDLCNLIRCFETCYLKKKKKTKTQMLHKLHCLLKKRLGEIFKSNFWIDLAHFLWCSYIPNTLDFILFSCFF